MSKIKIKPGLGRGFDALIPTHVIDDELDPTSQQDKALSNHQELPVDKLEPNYDQPRRHFAEEPLEELAESIRAHGILLPLIVSPRGDKYQIIAGERRWRAASMAGLATVPVVVRTLDDQNRLEVALIENLQREDLNVLEMATAYLKLYEQFNLTYEEMSKRVGKAVSTISNQMRLLGLPEAAKKALVAGDISEGHARQILAVKEPEMQIELLRLIIANGWSVRKAEQFVVGYREGEKNQTAAVAKTRTETPATKALGERLHTKVQIKNMAKGGQLVITFKSEDDLERITGLLGA